MKLRYEAHVSEIQRETAGLDIPSSTRLHNQFTLFSANMEHFLPFICPDNHERLFREALCHQRLASLELQYGIGGHLPKITGWNAEWAERLKHRPAIIACSHMGPHMLIGLLLAKAKVPTALLVASHMVEPLYKIWLEGAKQNPTMVMPCILDASSRSSLRKIIRYVRAGINLLVYWDGEEYRRDTANHDNRLSLPFLGQHLLVHRGAAFIAHKTQTPIVPVVTFRQQDGTVGMHLGEEIQPGTTNPQRFASVAMQSVLNCFSKYLMHFPMQWDKWAELQRFVIPEQFFIESNRQFSSEYGLLKHDESYFLFGRKNYKATQLSQDDFAYLHRNPTQF